MERAKKCVCVCVGGMEDILENFCLALFFVGRVRTAYKSVLCVSEKYLALRWRGQENRCHLFNKLILIGKKNVGWIWKREGGSMWSCLSIGRFYGTEEQIKFSWTSQTDLTPKASRSQCTTHLCLLELQPVRPASICLYLNTKKVKRSLSLIQTINILGLN